MYWIIISAEYLLQLFGKGDITERKLFWKALLKLKGSSTYFKVSSEVFVKTTAYEKRVMLLKFEN